MFRVKHGLTYDQKLIKSEVVSIHKFVDGMRLDIPLFASTIKCGFPSPADDYVDSDIDLNRDLIRNKDATFYGKADSGSMEPLIYSSSMLIIDRRCQEIYPDGRAALPT